MRPHDLHDAPNALARHYTRFRVEERVLLTGHSHQAWPDRALRGQLLAWEDAAERVDGKWDRAFERAERVCAGYTRLLNDESGHLALGQNTHELVVRFLSALPLRDRPRVVTTDGEFHSIRRQLDRLAEEGLEVVRLPAQPVEELPSRVEDAVDDRTAAVLVSSVLFENARIVPGLDRIAEVCRRTGTRLLVDAYHHLNVIPFSIEALGLEDAFVVGGGYKYCQLGEGTCFLRLPPRTRLRPAVTGWFAEFGAVVAGGREGEERRVVYGPGPARFAGATYDPTSHYRAAEVFDFFRDEGLDPEFLRTVNRHQVELLAEAFDALDLDPAAIARDRTQPLSETGGFLALRTPSAAAISERLLTVGVHTDHRGDRLRLGPAPYLTDAQLLEGVEAIGEVIRRPPGEPQ